MVLNIYKHPHELSYYYLFYDCSNLCTTMINNDNLVRVTTSHKVERRCRRI